MAKNKYSNKFDTVVEVAEKVLLTEYLTGKGLIIDSQKELNQDYVHELLDGLATEDDRLDITEEIECMEDLASEFIEQTREYVLDDPKYKVEWTKEDSNETIILRIFLKHKNAYKLIYDLFLCDKFWAKLHHYSLEADKVNFSKERINAFKADLQKYLLDQKKDDDCDIREHIYKNRNYILILRGDEKKTVTILEEGKKKHRVFRPAKEDMIVYDKEHSVIAMTPGIGGKKNKIFFANAFNKHILDGQGDIGKEFFSADNYLVDLRPLLTKAFYERTANVSEVRLTYLFAVKRTNPETEIVIKSEDVIKSLDSLGYHIANTEVVSARLDLKIEGERDLVPVRLTQRSTSQLNKTKEREVVEDFLRTRKIISF